MNKNRASQNGALKIKKSISDFMILLLIPIIGITFSMPKPAQSQCFLYVTHGSSTVSVISAQTNNVTTTIPVRNNLRGIAVTPDGAFAYVAAADRPFTVSIIATATNTVVETIELGVSLGDLAITPDGAFVYVIKTFNQSVSVISTVSNTVVATIPVGKFPEHIAIDPNGTYAYVTNGDADNVSVIDLETNTVVATIDVGPVPSGIAITPDGAFAYVANSRWQPTVQVVDLNSRTIVATVRVFSSPEGIAITPDGAFVYVANCGFDNVSVIRTMSNTVIATIPVGANPRNIAITPDGKFAYVTNMTSNTVSVIETASNMVIATIPVADSPMDIAITPLVNQPPIANAGPDQTLEATSPSGAEVTLDGSGSHDYDGDPLTYTWWENSTIIAGPTSSPTSVVTLTLGRHTIELNVDDRKGGVDTDEVVVDIIDTTPPALSVSVEPNVLWPPNHKMIAIHATVIVNDVADPNPTFVLTSIVSNEPDNGPGDGVMPNDIQEMVYGTPDLDFKLRAERSGIGDGRIYTVTYTATDASGNSHSMSAMVTVPHDVGPVNALPENFDLFANHPNPFNQETQISFQLPRAAYTVLKIFNTLGQEIRTIIDQPCEAGSHTIRWDGSDNNGNPVVSGTYLYQIKAGDFMAIKKLVVLK